MTDTANLTLYHGAMSRSIRVRWCLEEMGLPYTLERPDFKHGNVGGEAYKVVHPLQKIPALKDGDQTLFESVAICEYLAHRYGPTDLVVKPQEADFGRYLEWLHFGEASMSMPVNLILAHTLLLPEERRNPGLAAWARQTVDKQLALVAERGLDGGKRSYLAGERLTLADMSLIYMLYLLKITKQFDTAPQAVSDYFNRLRQVESWQRASAD
jgi:glutathione S-transferase